MLAAARTAGRDPVGVFGAAWLNGGMNEPDRSARPSQVTVAGWAVAIASVMLVVAVFDGSPALTV